MRVAHFNSGLCVYCADLLDFLVVVYTWLGPPVRLSLSGSGVKNLLKDSSPSRDGAKYCLKVRHDVRRALR